MPGIDHSRQLRAEQRALHTRSMERPDDGALASQPDASREPETCVHGNPMRSRYKRAGCAQCFDERDLRNVKLILGILATDPDRRSRVEVETLAAFCADWEVAS